MWVAAHCRPVIACSQSAINAARNSPRGWPSALTRRATPNLSLRSLPPPPRIRSPLRAPLRRRRSLRFVVLGNRKSGDKARQGGALKAKLGDDRRKLGLALRASNNQTLLGQQRLKPGHVVGLSTGKLE